MNLLLNPATARTLSEIEKHPVSSVIFCGPRGVGKTTAALELAKRLNCLGDSGSPCPNCRRIEGGNFPDVAILGRGDKPSIGIEQVRVLITGLALRPFEAKGFRVAIVGDAQALTPEAQNALLKLIEEPPPRTLIVLLTERVEALLLTVRSRCRTVRFGRPELAALQSWLQENFSLSKSDSVSMAAASDGLPGVAAALARDPAAVVAQAELSQQAADAPQQPVFERLLLAARLITTRADLERFDQLLHRQAVTAATASQGGSLPATQLAALNVFRTQIAAKVTPRVALERLMLEIGA